MSNIKSYYLFLQLSRKFRQKLCIVERQIWTNHKQTWKWGKVAQLGMIWNVLGDVVHILLLMRILHVSCSALCPGTASSPLSIRMDCPPMERQQTLKRSSSCPITVAVETVGRANLLTQSWPLREGNRSWWRRGLWNLNMWQVRCWIFCFVIIKTNDHITVKKSVIFLKWEFAQNTLDVLWYILSKCKVIKKVQLYINVFFF